MSVKVTYEGVEGHLEDYRRYVHAWATKHPFTFGTICALAVVLIGWVF